MESYLEHALYRSTLEILNNVMVHAHATEIGIQIIKNHQDITMMIEDNGNGFNPDEIHSNKGLGLKSTFSRIESLNGKLYIDSVSGRGSIITIIVPV
jgi:signal transduction histidine kinase